MTKVLLKYKIIEHCIEIWFRNVFRNFRIGSGNDIQGKFITDAHVGIEVAIRRESSNWDDETNNDDFYDTFLEYDIGEIHHDDGDDWKHDGIQHYIFVSYMESDTCIFPNDMITIL